MKMISAIFVILATFAIGNIAQADEIKFESESWEQVLELAQKSNKYIYLDAYTDWCGWCKVMDRETFTDKKVIDFMNENFIPARFEMETGFGKKIAMKYQVRAFPTSMFFTPQGQLIYLSPGFFPPTEFIETLEMALDKKNHMNFKGYSNDFNVKYPKFYEAIFAKRGSPEKRYPRKEQVNEYLSQSKDRFDEATWAVLSTFETNQEFNDFFLANITKYEELYGYHSTGDKLYGLVYAKLQEVVENDTQNGLSQVLAMIDKYDKNMAQQNKDYYTNVYYERTNNWDKIAEITENKIANNQLSPEQINERCWTIFEKCDDNKIVQKATQWIKNAVDSSPSYALMDTYAALLYKSKDYDNAEKIANKAIELGKSNGDNTKATEQLLEEIRGNSK